MNIKGRAQDETPVGSLKRPPFPGKGRCIIIYLITQYGEEGWEFNMEQPHHTSKIFETD